MISGPLRVMLVDDHAQVRAAVRQALSAPDIEVVGEASSGDEALLMAPQLNPDVLLLDLRMPDMDGLQLLRELVPRLPGTRIVMLTVSEDRRDVFEAMRCGAAGYLTKDLTPDALQRSIRGIRIGHLPMSRTMAAEVIHHLTAAARHFPSAPGEGDLASLSRAERAVLGHLADGLTDAQIADQLGLAPNAVEDHVRSILEKLGVHDRGQAARALRGLDRQEA
jgi:two-component system NarL family response regulator